MPIKEKAFLTFFKFIIFHVIIIEYIYIMIHQKMINGK